MCNACFNKQTHQAKTTFTVETKDSIIVIKNVPCLECEVCREITYTDEVSEKLEVFVAVAKKRSYSQEEVKIIDYCNVTYKCIEPIINKCY